MLTHFRKNPNRESSSIQGAHITYSPSYSCKHGRVPDEDICLKCGQCGRKFKNGRLKK